jgi:hypothetical protein
MAFDTRIGSTGREAIMAEKKVAYQVGGRQFEGMIVYDESATSKRPVVFMQPDW